MIDGAGGMVADRHPECMMSVTRHGASRSQFFRRAKLSGSMWWMARPMAKLATERDENLHMNW